MKKITSLLCAFLFLFLFLSASAQGPYLKKNLSPEQLAEYGRAVEAEAAVAPLVEEYLELERRLRELDAQIAGAWESAFDGKTYLYNLAMDKAGNAAMLSLYEQKLNAVRAEQAELAEKLRVPAARNYLLQRRLLTEYEIALGEELGKEFATPAQIDTLRTRLARIPKND